MSARAPIMRAMTGPGDVGVVVDEAGQLTYLGLDGQLRSAGAGCLYLDPIRLGAQPTTLGVEHDLPQVQERR